MVCGEAELSGIASVCPKLGPSFDYAGTLCETKRIRKRPSTFVHTKRKVFQPCIQCNWWWWGDVGKFLMSTSGCFYLFLLHTHCKT